ncbi:diguanylate cyclase domain-containing protein [Actinoplanes sp. G11-F43]|uniref:GGDEF domain-containing protein n=1 Tax=Actinoplanes sp. G11-F43 TaxID=3424130 RepID=UPI003D337AF6
MNAEQYGMGGWRSRGTAGLVLLLMLGVVTVVTVPFLPSTVVVTAQLAYTVLGLFFAARAGRSADLPPRIRRAWRLMLPSYALWLIVTVLYAIYPGKPFPSVPEILHLMLQPVTLVGIWAFIRMPDTRAEKVKLWLDAAVVAVGSAMVLWFLVLSPALAESSSAGWRELTPSILRPLLDAMMLFGVSIVLLQGTTSRVARLPLMTLVGAVMLILMGDTRRAYVINHGGSLMPSADQSMLWAAGLFLLALAPCVQIWESRRPQRDGGFVPSPGLARWPYLTAIPGYLLLMFTVGIEHPYPAAGLIGGAFLVTTLVFARQMVAARENHRMAVTDQLTGLANRVQMYDAVPRALARAQRNHTTVAALVIDMNGFKQINDEFGHQAGDRLLIGFGRLLRRSVLGADLVVRLGGDEFAVFLVDLPEAGYAQAVLQRIRAAMAVPIDVGATMVQPTASIGVAFATAPDDTVDDLLHRADVAMYEIKRQTKTPN